MTTPILPYAIQIYSLRNLGSLQAMLDCLKAAGHTQVELIGSQLEDAANTRAALDARGLTAVSSHVSIAQLRNQLPAIAAACHTLGVKQLHMPSVPPTERDSPAAYWLALGRELGGMARTLAAQGIALGYHNHHWELQVKEGGQTALECLWQGAAEVEQGSPPSSLLGWQMDVAWMVRGGADPVAWMQREAKRLVSLHAKDLAPAGEKADEDGWADVGTGTLDWPMLARAGKRHGATWLVAEHDKPNDPARFARNSARFLAQLAD